MAGTTGGGAFRYPTEHTNYTEPLRQALREAGISEDLVEEWNSLTMDRDRALEDYLTVAAASVGSFFDAIVDGTQAASKPSERIFIDIGEALVALGALGLTSVTIGVKAAGATAYQETASITSGIPARVRIIGAGPHPSLIDTPTTNGVVWDLRGRRLEFTNVTIENICIRSSLALSNGATDLFNSSSLTNLHLVDCLVLSNSTFMNQLNGVSNDCRILLQGTDMSNMAYGRARWVYHDGGTMSFSSTYTFTTVMQPSAGPTGGDANCYLVGVHLQPTSATVNLTWNNANSESVVMAGCSVIDRSGVGLIPSSSRLNLTFVGRPCIDLHNSSGTNGTNVTVTFSGTTGGSSCELSGAQGANSGITVFTKTGTNPCSFKGDVTSFDVTGPARIQTTHNTTTGVTSGILRGAGIVADIEMQSSHTGTALQLIGVTASVVRAAFRTTTTLNRAYSLDATSNNNICDFAGASIATNPGTDAGAGNIIRQT